MSILKVFRNPFLLIHKITLCTTAADTPSTTSAIATTEDTPTGAPAIPISNLVKDRSRIISVETSIRYLKSEAFKKTYEGYPVWKFYRRNFKGQTPPETRKSCICTLGWVMRELQEIFSRKRGD